MKKAELLQKIQLFQNQFPEYRISKNGNFYCYISGKNSNPINEPPPAQIKYTGFNITKGTIGKLGQTITTFSKKDSVLLTSTGKLMTKLTVTTSSTYRMVTPKVLFDLLSYGAFEPHINILAEIFFIGKKAQWLKSYSCLWPYRFFQSFTSCKEAKEFLGYGALSDHQFISLFLPTKGENHERDILAGLIKGDDKSAGFIPINNLIVDYVNVAVDKNDLVRIKWPKTHTITAADIELYKHEPAEQVFDTRKKWI